MSTDFPERRDVVKEIEGEDQAPTEEFSELPDHVVEAVPNIHAKTPQMAVLEYEERYLEVRFELRYCTCSDEETEHKVETDHYRDRTTLECRECNRTRTPATDGGTSASGTDRRPAGRFSVTELPTPYAPGVEAKTVEDLDGIDLDQGEGCPHCGGRRDNLYVPNAGYYGCETCGAVWGGDRNNASLKMEPHSGPVCLVDPETERGIDE